MTAEKFRHVALEIPSAVEASHMNHPDFRIGGRIFASLGYPDDEHGMVNLAPDQQREFLRKAPGVFAPCAGMWGKRGATNVNLAAVRVGLLRLALEAAAQMSSPRKGLTSGQSPWRCGAPPSLIADLWPGKAQN